MPPLNAALLSATVALCTALSFSEWYLAYSTIVADQAQIVRDLGMEAAIQQQCAEKFGGEVQPQQMDRVLAQMFRALNRRQDAWYRVSTLSAPCLRMPMPHSLPIELDLEVYTAKEIDIAIGKPSDSIASLVQPTPIGQRGHRHE